MSDETLTYPTIKPCIVCKKELKSVLPAEHNVGADNVQPNGGVSFSGYGVYGSAHDCSPEFVVNVCDDCLQKAIDANEVLISTDK